MEPFGRRLGPCPRPSKAPLGTALSHNQRGHFAMGEHLVWVSIWPPAPHRSRARPVAFEPGHAPALAAAMPIPRGANMVSIS